MTSDKVPMPFSGRKDRFFLQMVLEKLDIHMQDNKVGPLPTIVGRVNSKWVKNLNFSPTTTKRLEGNIKKNSQVIKRSVLKKTVIILNVYALNRRASKCMR